MNLSKWLIFGAALFMIAGTALCLSDVSHRQRLGNPGVRIRSAPLYDEHGQIAARQSVPLPDQVLGIKGKPVPLLKEELDGLPKDTTFGQMVYEGADAPVQLTVVVMGTDRTSIHQPQYCLDGHGWHIERTERVVIPIDRPFHYDVPALKLSIARTARENGREIVLHGFYVYWFVSGEHLTSDMGTRLFSQGWTMLRKGELERWGYISYLQPCLPGQEEVAYKKLLQFIRASVPEFQIPPENTSTALNARL